MPTITAIERQKRRTRADIYVDGVFVVTVSLELIAEQGLAAGDEVRAGLLSDLEHEDQRREAIAWSLQALAMRPRSEKDLRQRLRRRNLPIAAIDSAVARLRELGYLDDAAFARFWVDMRQASTPRSRRALAFELTGKGIGRDVTAEAVEAVSDAEAAYRAAQRRLRALRGLDRPAFMRRLGTFLAARGFGYGVARATVERCWLEIAGDLASVNDASGADLA